MRKVAGLFAVDVAALYRHFGNKDELLAEVGRVASDLVDLKISGEGSWEDRFLALAEAIRDRISAHPELGLYGGGSPWATPFIARANGLIASLFCEAGLKGDELVFATQTALHVVTSMAQSEVMTRSASSEMNRDFAVSIREQLPKDVQKAWPATRARNDWSVDFNALFEFSIRRTLEGLVPSSKRAG